MLVLYHDIPSAGSLCAVLRLQRLADDGLPITFRGFDVLGIEATIPATLDDLNDFARHRAEAEALGWTIRRPSVHPPTLQAHLVAELAERDDLGAAWRRATYRAHWVDGVDISDPTTLLELAVSVGLRSDEARELLDDAEDRNRARRRMLVHRGDGIGGVPVLDAAGTFVSPFIDDADLRHLAAL